MDEFKYFIPEKLATKSAASEICKNASSIIATFSAELSTYLFSSFYNSLKCDETEFVFLNVKNSKNHGKENICLFVLHENITKPLTSFEEKFHKYHVMCKRRMSQNRNTSSDSKKSKLFYKIVLGCFVCFSILLVIVFGVKHLKVST